MNTCVSKRRMEMISCSLSAMCLGNISFIRVHCLYIYVSGALWLYNPWYYQSSVSLVLREQPCSTAEEPCGTLPDRVGSDIT